MAKPGNLRYRIFCGLRQASWSLKGLVPSPLIAPKRNLGQAFAIGITTYSERYDSYFKPLYKSLSRIFPEVPISVAVNGHGSADDQFAYLQRFQAEICRSAPAHHRFILNDKTHGLTSLWNGLLASVPLGLPLLILNDDLSVNGWFRHWAEAFDWSSTSLSLLNTSWSHFVIAPSCVEQVGAFDPGFPGIGFEDMDYTARAGLAGVTISNHLCGYIHHKDDKPKTTSFDDRFGRIWGKYTSANQAHFAEQWERCDSDEGVFIKQLHGHVKPRGPVQTFALPMIRPADWVDTCFFPDRSA